MGPWRHSGCEDMLYDTTRTRSGNMPPDLTVKVDGLLEEFMAVVDAMTDERHLQRGIARSQLQNSMVAVLDSENLSIMAEIQSGSRFASYYYSPDISLTRQQAANSAQWEFGLVDPFIIQFPRRLLEQGPEERLQELRRIASEHIDSEFRRLMDLLSITRTRPIFGSAIPMLDPRSVLLLLPQDGALRGNEVQIRRAVEGSGLSAYYAPDIRCGRSSVHALWSSINQAAIVIADLTGPDPGVMYGLGIAHTLGKQSVMVYPHGSMYLTDIPRTYGIEYEEDDGRAMMEERLKELLRSMVQPVA